jgi:hypothetical protein
METALYRKNKIKWSRFECCDSIMIMVEAYEPSCID